MTESDATLRNTTPENGPVSSDTENASDHIPQSNAETNHSGNDSASCTPSDALENDAGKDDIDTKKESDEDKRIRSESLRIMAQLGNFGMFLVLALLFSYFIGNAMDSFFGTKPVFTVFWIACGVFASFRELYRNIRKAMKLAQEPNISENSDNKQENA